MVEKKVKRDVKDSVFKSLFSQRENQKKLIEELFPEEGEVDENLIISKQVVSTFVKGFVNDFSVVYKNSIVFMVEEQTNWDNNLTIRFVLYVQEFLKEYIRSEKINLFSENSVADSLPDFKLAIIYLGDQDRKDIDVAKEVPKLHSNLIIKVINHGPVRNGILDQYIHFGKTNKEMIKKYKADPDKAMKETISVCEKNGWLNLFIKEHKNELMENSMLFYSVEEIDELIRRESFEKGEKKGIEKGEKKGSDLRVIQLYNKRLTTMSDEDARKCVMDDFDLTEKELSEILDSRNKKNM